MERLIQLPMGSSSSRVERHGLIGSESTHALKKQGCSCTYTISDSATSQNRPRITMSTLRDQLRAIPSLVGTPPSDFPVSPPSNPREFFLKWLLEAVDQGVPEPHHITLVTIDEHGFPDARVLVIKDITPDGSVEVALSTHSPKGQQLAQNSHAAISWYCSPHVRAIRIKGIAERAEEEVSAADWMARKLEARAVVCAGKQSEPFDGPREERVRLAKEAEERLRSQDGQAGLRDWAVWRIRPETIEFWQGAKDRNHDRLKYTRTSGGWDVATLWP